MAIKAKHSKLLVISFLMASAFVLLIVTVSWYQKNNEYKLVLDGYINKTAYNSCVEKAKEIESNDLFFSIDIIKNKCEKQYGSWKRVRKEGPTFSYVLLNNFYEKIIVTLIFTSCIYVVMSSYVLYAKCDSIGWRRLAIIAAFIPSTVAAFWFYNNLSSGMNGRGCILILLASITGYISTVFVILGGRQVIAWIKEGFMESQ